MKLGVKLCGLFASGAFVLIGLSGAFSTVDFGTLFSNVTTGDAPDTAIDTTLSAPLKVLYYAVPGAVLAGFLGYWIGSTLSHPKGPSQEEIRRRKKERAQARQNRGKVSQPLTGNETFLEDLEEAGTEGDQPPQG